MAARAKPPFCYSCGAMMYEARLLKNGQGLDPNRLTCALHGPNGQFRHLGSDRPSSTGSDDG